MLTRQTIRSLESEPEIETVELALVTLANSGVLVMQIESLQRQLMSDFTQKEPAQLVGQITEIQSVSKVLLGIHNLGKQIAKEKLK